MSSMLAKLSVGFFVVGRGLDSVLSSMVPIDRRRLSTKGLFFRSDKEALQHDWKCICGDMQTICRDLKR